MFPEFLANDSTFGTNVQRRPLFAVTGIDGRNKIFCAFRAYLPSKERYAFRWILSTAMEVIIGKALMKHVSVVASDEEDAMITSLRSHLRPLETLPHTKHRLD